MGEGVRGVSDGRVRKRRRGEMTKAGKRDAASHGIRVACDSLVSQCVADRREAKKKKSSHKRQRCI